MSDQRQPDPQPQTVVNVTMTNTNQATATTTASEEPDAWVRPARKRSRRSTLAAYLVFAVGAWAGLHRLYLKRPHFFWLLLTYALAAVALSMQQPLVLLGAGAMLCLDFVALPRWVRRYNADRGLPAPAPATARRPPLLRGLGWRRAEIPPAATAARPASVIVPATQPAAPAAPSPEEERQDPGPDLRTLLLREAYRGDGRLTVTHGVMSTGMDWERVEACLREMVPAGYVDVDNEPNSGVIVYVFPEIAGRPRPDRAEQ